MNKRILIALIVLSSIAVAFLLLNRGPEMNENIYFNPSAMVMGTLKYEANIENAVKRFSSHIIIGTALSISPLDNNYDIADIQIKDCLRGEFEKKSIEIRIHKSLLEKDKTYILFFKEINSPIYGKKMNILFSEYVMEIYPDNSVAVISNPMERKYIKPFKEEKYNNLQYIEDYINRK